MTPEPADDRATLLDWLSGVRVVPRSRRALYVAAAISVASLLAAYVQARGATRPLRTGKGPPAIPQAEGDAAFGLPLETRKRIFAEIAAAEPFARTQSKKNFNGPGLEWSAEDDRGAFERKTVASLTAKYGVSTTQVYLVLDEGIRARWPGPDGKPLDPTVVPLHPRRYYGW